MSTSRRRIVACGSAGVSCCSTRRAESEAAEARGRASAFKDLASAVGDADSAAARKLYMDAIQRVLNGAELRTVSGSPEEPARVFLDG